MNTLDKLRAIINSLSDDGSKEIASQWIETATTAAELHELMQNPAFKRIIESQRNLLLARLRKLIEKDPQLKALHAVLVSTLGPQAAAEQIERVLEELSSGQA